MSDAGSIVTASDYELVNARRWEDRDKKTPTRKRKNNNKKKKPAPSSIAGSPAPSVVPPVAPSVVGSVRGQTPGPATPGPATPGPATRGPATPGPATPARSVQGSSSRGGGDPVQPPTVTSYQSSETSWPPFPSSASETGLLSPNTEYEPSSPWDDVTRSRRQYDSDLEEKEEGEGEEGDPSSEEFNSGYYIPEVEGAIHSVFTVPNYYGNDDPALELDAYEGPDGLRRENDGDRAERAGQPPDAIFSLPARRHPDFDEYFFGPRSVNLRHIAGKSNTHLEIPPIIAEPQILIWGRPRNVTIARRDLQRLMEHIFRQIDGHIKEKKNQRRDPKQAWEKIRAAPSDRMQQWIEKKLREDAKRRQFRHPPPKEPFEFDAFGAFMWPKETSPQDSLGKSFERLDDIRYECEVYILHKREKEKDLICVLGENPEDTQKAIDRIFGTFCEVAARNRKGVEKFLVHPPSMNLQNVSVRLIKERELQGRHVTAKVPPGSFGVRGLLAGDISSPEFLENWRVRREKLEKANYAYIKQVAQQGLKDVFYFRGHASLKIHFGALVFFGYQQPPPGGLFTLENFCSMVRDPSGQTAGEVIRYIGEEHVAKALIHECLVRKDLFHHADVSSFAFAEDAYSDVLTDHHFNHTGSHTHIPEPALEASFECKMVDRQLHSQDVRLEVKFERIPGRHPGDMTNERGDLYKVGMRRWLFVRSRDSNPNPKGAEKAPRTRSKGPFEMKVLDLENDLAWQFELTTYKFYPDADIYSLFTEFVKRIRIEDIPDESDPIGPPEKGKPDRRGRVQRVSYVNLPGMTVEKVVMKTKHQYWIKRTSYMFEITRYECFFTEEVDTLYPQGIRISWKGLETNHDTRWGATLTNADWTNTLSKQTSLGIGCNGGWDPDVNEFFKSSSIGGFDHPAWTREGDILESPDPWGGDGWKELMTRINEIARFIATIRDANVGLAEPGYAGPEEFDA